MYAARRKPNEALVTMTDEELIEEFVNTIDRDEKTLQKYRGFLEEFSEWLGKNNATLLTACVADVIRYLAYLKSDKRLRPCPRNPERLVPRPLGASSRKGVLAALRNFYRHCTLMEYFAGLDPTFGIETPRVAITRGLTIDKRAIRRLLDAPGRERDRVQAHLEVFTLGRSNSFRELRWPDVDFEENVIHFDSAKFNKAYTLPIHLELRAALLRWRSAQLEEAETNEALAEALRSEDTAYVLLTRNGKRLAHSTISKQLKWRAARVGILPYSPDARPDRRGENKSRLSPHAIRRSIATIMRREGQALEDVADLLNHSDVNTTRKHYAFTDTPRQRRIVGGIRL